MKKINNLSELLEEQIKEHYCVEKSLLESLPDLVLKTHDSELKMVLEKYCKGTKDRVNRLDRILSLLRLSYKTVSCQVAEELVERVQKMTRKCTDTYVTEAGVIFGVQCINHFQIASYGTLTAFARTVSEIEVAAMLQKSLDEEKKANQELNRIATDSINRKAMIKVAVID
jgi:ferritin-like metal-binding protein YciE